MISFNKSTNKQKDMVKKLVYAGMLCSALLWWGCSPTEQTQAITVEVDLNARNDTDCIEDIFAIERLIPLQAGGMISSVDKLYKQDSLIYVLDQRQKSLFVFNEEGQQRLILKRKGRTPGKRSSLDDFAIDPEGNIYLFDALAQEISRHNAQGAYLYKTKVCSGAGFTLAGPDSLVIYCDTQSKNNLTVFKADGTRLQDIAFPKSVPVMLSNRTGGVFVHDGRLFFTNPFDYTLYTVEGGKARAMYTFDFGSRNLPQDIQEETDKKRLLEKLISRSGVLYLEDVAFHDGRLFFTIDGNTQCMMDTQTCKVSTFSRKTWPYLILLERSVTVCPDGTFLSIVTDEAMKHLLSASKEMRDAHPFIPSAEEIPPMEPRDFWVVEGHIK